VPSLIGIRVSRAVIAEMEKRNGEVNEMRVVFFFLFFFVLLILIKSVFGGNYNEFIFG
jgi:hypothetical protein